MLRFWRAAFAIGVVLAIPGGVLALIALKHLQSRMPAIKPVDVGAWFDLSEWRRRAWGRMN